MSLRVIIDSFLPELVRGRREKGSFEKEEESDEIEEGGSGAGRSTYIGVELANLRHHQQG
jgi:hypothetical protein